MIGFSGESKPYKKPGELAYPMDDVISEEWERAIEHLFEVSIPRRCPGHVEVLRKYHSFLLSQSLRPPRGTAGFR